MFLRATQRTKDGKTHRYWSVVENRRVRGGGVVQKTLLYLGEINDSQHAGWCRSIEAVDGKRGVQMALFPEDRTPPPDVPAVQVRMSQLTLERPRQWGACWLAMEVWDQLHLDEFWAARLPDSREGTSWRNVLKTLTAYRLIDPGSEWQLHRLWYDRSAMADLLGEDFRLAQKDTLYRCLDKLVEHKAALFGHLKERWSDLFDAKFEVLLYDLTSTYFESDPPESTGGLRRYGYSRDKRSDCVQVVIALIVTPEGFPLTYEVLSGNTLDSTTLAAFLQKIETLYGKADRIWVMDRGIPTEESLEQMRASDPPIQYLVGTPKGRLSRLEQAFLSQPWRSVRDGVEVKLVPEDGEIYVLARSADRVLKERAMRRRKLKRLWKRLRQLQTMSQTREELLMRLGAARRDAGHAWRLVSVRTDPFSFDLNRPKLRQVRRREGRYLLRTNLPGNDPAALWPMYIQLTEVEQAFKEIKHDLGLRPIFHQKDARIEAHIFVSFLAYCLQVTLKHRLRPCAPGLTPRSALEQMKGIQMLDVRIPTTDGRQLTLSRTTQPDPAQQLLLARLQMALPPQPPPRITTPAPGETADVVKT
jgi:transposase